MKNTAKMSEAYKKADVDRDNMNNGRVKVLAKDLSCVCYAYVNRNNKPCAIGYVGRSKKPSFNYRYNSVKDRNEKINEWMSQKIRNNTHVKQTKTRELKVGSVLRASWGYDQTNLNFYKVISLIGKTMVEVVEIGVISESDGLSGVCVPNPSDIIGEPMRRRCDGDTVKICQSIWARKFEPKNVAGVDLFETSSFSSYH